MRTAISEQERPGAPRIGWRGLALIVVLWTLFAGVMTLSLYLSGVPGSGEVSHLGVVAFSLLGAYSWAAFTVPLLSLTRRFSPTGDHGSWRPLRIGGLLVLSVVFSGLMSVALGFMSWVVLRDMLGGTLASEAGPWVMARYRLMYDLLACELILTAGVALDYFLRYRQRLAEATQLRTQLAEARLEVLRAQLNPHFLFNTLNAVAAMVQTDPRGVRRMIALLSDLLRQTLDGSTKPEVPLERELELLRRYFEIMEIRFRGRLETRVTADSEVLRALVPHLILQPLVENALKHGIGRSDEPGLVEVEAERRGGELVLMVRDTGAGRTTQDPRPGVADPTGLDDDGPHGGFGLRHTRERLRQLYGAEAVLDLRAADGGGTVAEVRLPFHADRLPSPRIEADERADVASSRREAPVA